MTAGKADTAPPRLKRTTRHTAAPSAGSYVLGRYGGQGGCLWVGEKKCHRQCPFTFTLALLLNLRCFRRTRDMRKSCNSETLSSCLLCYTETTLSPLLVVREIWRMCVNLHTGVLQEALSRNNAVCEMEKRSLFSRLRLLHSFSRCILQLREGDKVL